MKAMINGCEEGENLNQRRRNYTNFISPTWPMNTSQMGTIVFFKNIKLKTRTQKKSCY